MLVCSEYHSCHLFEINKCPGQRIVMENLWVVPLNGLCQVPFQIVIHMYLF